MKKLLAALIFVTGILTTGLFAKNEITFSGGINLGNLGYDSGNGLRDTSMKPGPTFGFEFLKGPIIFGAAYVRRGGNWEINSIDYAESISLDYLTGYVLFNIPIAKDFSGIFGCQFGECMGGTINYEYDDVTGSVILYTDAFNLDFGIIFGADYMFNSKIGARVSYYAGYTGVYASETSNNFKNSGIGLCLLFKI